jgi:hypothetical protein
MADFRNPPVGTIVQWFPHADVTVESSGIAAGMITSVDGPGIISLTLYKRNSAPIYLQGVRHVTDPFHENRRESTQKSGGWDFVPAYEPDRWPPARRSEPRMTADAIKK